MTKPAMPAAREESIAADVVATRWWWVRHAPVRENDGRIYGQKDLGCDTSDRVVFAAVGKILPRDAVWFSSHLKRTHQTAAAIWSAGFPKPPAMQHEPELAEQHLGAWQGLNRAEFLASRPVEFDSYWYAPIDEAAPGGESFLDLYNRVAGAIARINAAHAGKDIIAVAHGGTIRAAIGLALGGQPEKGLAFTIDNCSVTRLDHFAGVRRIGWQIPMVNQQPWIAHASHNAMHQPAGPQIASAGKLA